jgi:hypothetical protein
MRRVYRALRLVTLPLVITGIVLSTLHQSSLGSLFLITPHRLHALWYSPILPVLFFVSAVALGLMTVVLESLIAAAFLGHRLHPGLLAGLGKVAAGVLLVYLGLRLGDLAVRGQLAVVTDGSWQSWLFLLELAVSVLIPVLLLLSPAGRKVAGVGAAAGLVVAGMVGYRLDVSVVALARPGGVSYFPSWMEFAVSLGIVAAASLVFLYFVEHLKVYDDVHGAPASEPPRASPATVRRLLPSRLAAVRGYSAAVLAAGVLAIPLLPLAGAERAVTPVSPARSVEAVKHERAEAGVLALASAPADAAGAPAPGPAAAGGDSVRLVLAIDGNRDGRMVLFDHVAHEDRAGGESACALCHHLDLPLDRNSGCGECHRDMYEPTATFSHRSHTRALPGDEGCKECHETGAARTLEGSTACVSCHADTLAVAGSPISSPHQRWHDAAGYLDAMHGLCLRCHEQVLADEPESHPPELAECRTCHDADLKQELQRQAPQRREAALTPDGSAAPGASQRRETAIAPGGAASRRPGALVILRLSARPPGGGAPGPARAGRPAAGRRRRSVLRTAADGHRREIDTWIRNHLFDEVPIAISVIGPDFFIVEANRQFRRTYGPWRGRRCYQVYKHRDSPCEQCPALETFSDGRIRSCQEEGSGQLGVPSHYLVRDGAGDAPQRQDTLRHRDVHGHQCGEAAGGREAGGGAARGRGSDRGRHRARREECAHGPGGRYVRRHHRDGEG